MKRLILSVLILTGLTAALPAQRNRAQYVRVTSAVVTPSTLRPGQTARMVITVLIAPGFHININKPADPSLIPTVLKPSGKGVSFGVVAYPVAHAVRVAYAPQPIMAYSGTVKIAVPVSVSRTAYAGKMRLGGTLSVQGCNDKACFPPTDLPVSASVTVTGGR